MKRYGTACEIEKKEDVQSKGLCLSTTALHRKMIAELGLIVHHLAGRQVRSSVGGKDAGLTRMLCSVVR